MHAETGNAVTIRFALPSASLRPYITTFYRIDVKSGASEPFLEDYLHPEWANLRILPGEMSLAAIGSKEMAPCPAYCVTGPTSTATRFRLRSGRSWGVGLMPLGWAAFTKAAACDYADRLVDGERDEAFALFRPLADALLEADDDFESELAIIERQIAKIAISPPRDEDSLIALNAALVDPETGSVAQLAEQTGMNVRSLERLSRRAFGFPPKLLLRRQRFLRSLAQFMLDPSMKWLTAIDFQYHDQAHFVRDFRRFMGMSPSVYSKLEKPLLVAAAQARMAIAGEAVQGLHQPEAAQEGN